MRVAVIGGNGFIGSHVVQELKDEVLVIHRTNLQDISKFQPEIVVNCAWEGVASLNSRNDEELQKKNLDFNEKLFDLCQFSCKRWIGTGSQLEVNGPEVPYAKYKLLVLNRIGELCKQNNISFAWARIFSTYGPGDKETNFLPYLIKELLANKDVPLTDQNIPWDYLFVQDAAKAICKLAHAQEEGVFELGSGVPNLTQDVARMIRDKINPNLKLLFGAKPCRPFELKELIADITRLNSIGWSPTVSLSDGLDLTIDYYEGKTENLCVRSS